jgi:hypothetical protein
MLKQILFTIGGWVYYSALERLPANAKIAQVLGSIPRSSNKMESGLGAPSRYS